MNTIQVPESHFQKFVCAEVALRPELNYYRSAETLRDKVLSEVTAILAKNPTAKITFPSNILWLASI